MTTPSTQGKLSPLGGDHGTAVVQKPYGAADDMSVRAGMGIQVHGVGMNEEPAPEGGLVLLREGLYDHGFCLRVGGDQDAAKDVLADGVGDPSRVFVIIHADEIVGVGQLPDVLRRTVVGLVQRNARPADTS